MFGIKKYKTSWTPCYWNVPMPTPSDMKIIKARFENQPLVKLIENDLKNNNYQDYNYLYKCHSGIQVRTDRVITKTKTYRYEDYNLSNLDIESTWELAIWLMDFCPRNTQLTIRTIYEYRSKYSDDDAQSKDGYEIWIKGTEVKPKTTTDW